MPPPWLSKFVVTKYTAKPTIAHTTIAAATAVIAINHWRLEGEHRVQVAERDGEYPPWHTEQSAPDARKPGDDFVGRWKLTVVYSRGVM